MSGYVMRKLFGVFALVLVLFQAAAFDAHAQGHSGAGGNDPFALSYAGLNFPTSCDTYGRHPTALQGVDITKKTLVLIQRGQSNNENTSPSAFTPVNTGKIDNLSICDGAIYPVPSDPLIGGGCLAVAGCGGSSCVTGCIGNVMTRVADALITAGTFDRVIIVPEGVGSTSVAMSAPGGALALYNNRTAVALRRLAAIGITASTTNVWIVDDWGQGEFDTGVSTSQVSYVASYNAEIAAEGPLAAGVRHFVNKESWNGSGFSTAVQAAQTATSPSGVINNTANIFLGANADSLMGSVCGASGTNPCRHPVDGLHFLDDGNISLKTLLIAAFHASGAPF